MCLRSDNSVYFTHAISINTVKDIPRNSLNLKHNYIIATHIIPIIIIDANEGENDWQF